MRTADAPWTQTLAIVTLAIVALSIIALAACAAAGPASAESPGAVVMMKGTCRKLTTPADDLSRACRSMAVSSSYTREGRVGFHFASGGRDVVFSGGAREIRVSDSAGVQAIDRVTIGAGGGETAIVAVGSCRYSHATTPRPTVNCRAETEEGNFLASFDIEPAAGGADARR